MRQFQSQIVSNRQLGADFFEMSLGWDAAFAGVPRPGQFLTVRVSRDSAPLLHRPFAFAGFDGAAGTVSIIYRKRGRGTEILASRQAGETVDALGPLGNTFLADDSLAAGNRQKTIIVAGGAGLGPILFLADHIKKIGIDAEFVFGCRSAALIPDAAAFQDTNPQICTDDGSAGYRGNVVQYISANVGLNENTVICACGPEPMLKGLCALAQSANAKTRVSLECVMACGVGVCMGCAAHTANGYLRVCKEGPVFNGEDIAWEK
jgi:dihydroorotate dehydrogenase electron transfer subunit